MILKSYLNCPELYKVSILAWILVIVSEGKGEIDLCLFKRRKDINSQL